MSNAAVDKILEPMWTNNESPPPQGQQIHPRAENSTAQEQRQKKRKVWGKRKTKIDGAIKNARRPSASPRPTNLAVNLAVNTNLPKRALEKERCLELAEINLPSPTKSPKARTPVFIPQTNAEAKFGNFEQPLYYKKY